MSNAVHRTGRIIQIGSQQRSSAKFRYAAELVRNGRIGELKKVYVGLPGDLNGEIEPAMPIPNNLNYDAWLGSTPYIAYTEKGVHPQNDYSRPGWLRCEQFGAGMILVGVLIMWIVRIGVWIRSTQVRLKYRAMLIFQKLGYGMCMDCFKRRGVCQWG